MPSNSWRSLPVAVLRIRSSFAEAHPKPEQPEKVARTSNWDKSPNFKCDDGHRVRSKAEVLIDNWLFKNGIVHSYEKRVPLVACHEVNPSHAEIYCDFYLPKLDAYVEFWGLDTQEYLARRSAKVDLYCKSNLRLVELEDSDMVDLDTSLALKLKRFQ